MSLDSRTYEYVLSVFSFYALTMGPYNGLSVHLFLKNSVLDGVYVELLK